MNIINVQTKSDGMRCLLVLTICNRFWTALGEGNLEYCTLLVTETIYEDNRFSRSLECEIPGNRILRFENLPRDLERQLQNGDIRSNEDMFPMEGVAIGNKSIYVPDGASIDLLKSEYISTSPDLMLRPLMDFPYMNKDDRNREGVVDFRPLGSEEIVSTENRKVEGIKNVLAIWVKAADAETAMPMDDGTSNSLANKIFGVY